MKQFDNTESGYKLMGEYIIESFGNIDKYKIRNPKDISAMFLAGSPGAGKTEFLNTILVDLKKTFIVIDVDKYRKLFHGYNGHNSSEFQRGSVRVAEKVLKHCFKNNLNFVFDGTFRNMSKVQENFDQCTKYNRKSSIALVFQEPRISYYYTFLRKLERKRNVPIDVFVDGFYNSIQNSFAVVEKYGNVNIMIAAKRYLFLDKEIFYYEMDYKVRSLYGFCAKYKIYYHKGKFKNKGKLELDIETYHHILSEHFSLNSGWSQKWSLCKLWIIEKRWKLF